MSRQNILFVLVLVCYYGVRSLSSKLCDATTHSKHIETILKKELGHKYEILQGHLQWQHQVKWVSNPSGIYGAYLFPYSTGLTTYDNNSPDIILHPHDAVVFAGCTPPHSRYYSVVNYLFNQYKPNGDIDWIFGSLGASLNHLVINVTDNNPFNTLSNIIHTGDNDTYSDIYNVLSKIHKTNINLLNVPNMYFKFAPYSVDNKHMIYHEEFDSFMPFWRIALPLNNTQFNQYTAINQTGVFYLKYAGAHTVNDTKPVVEYTPFVRDPYSSKLQNESIYSKDLWQYVQDLIYNVSNTYNLTAKWQKQFTIDPSHGESGFYCINGSGACAGDNRDDSFSAGGGYYNLYNNNTYIVVGINSNALNLTTYQNIDYQIGGSNILWQSSKTAITNFDFVNSAIDLNIATNISHQSVSKMFVIQYSRPNTFINGMMGFNISEQEINSTQQFEALQRHYLNKITRTRPDYYNLIPSYFIKFEANNI